MKNQVLPFILFSILFINTKAQSNYLPLGVHLCGGEFGENKMPGTHGVDYTYPDAKEIGYFALKGFKMVNVPFRWERIQHAPGGPIERDEINELKRIVTTCSQNGMKVILSMHNFGRFKMYGQEYIIGSPQVTREHFKAIWKELAATFAPYGNIYAFNIMSEPHDMMGYSWAASAQWAIDGIREVEKTKSIIIGGDDYSNPIDWVKYSDNLKYLKDPSNKIVYDAHCYFDSDRSGRYHHDYTYDGAYDNIGIDRVKPFVDWLKRNNKKGIVGEFGVPSYDNRWLKVLDKFLAYLSEEKISGNYWAAGSWWYNYSLSIQPVYGTDKPQMFVLQKYMFAKNNTSNSNSNKSNNILTKNTATNRNYMVASYK